MSETLARPIKTTPTRQEQLHQLAALRLHVAELETRATQWGPALASSHGPETQRNQLGSVMYDLAMVTVACAASYVLAARLHLYERFAAWTSQLPGVDGGPLAILLVALGFSSAWFVYRRWPKRHEETNSDGRAGGSRRTETASGGRGEQAALEISEREKRRIRQNLYVGLGQQLSGLACLGRLLEQKLASRSIQEVSDAAKLVDLLDQAVIEIRELAEGIYPTELETEGFVAALKTLAANTEKRSGIYCRVSGDSPGHFPEPGVAVQLYRIAQEAVNHAVQRGKAHHVLIDVATAPGHIKLTVCDRAGSMERAEQISGAALRTMQFRARMIDAKLELRRDPGGAHLVTCRLPLRAIAEEPVGGRKGQQKALTPIDLPREEEVSVGQVSHSGR